MRLTCLRKYMPNKRYIKGEKLEKSIWELTHGQIHGKDHSFAGIRPVPTPRLAPHLDPFAAVENVPREVEDMSDYFNWRKDNLKSLEDHPVRDFQTDMKYFARRYVISIHRKTCKGPTMHERGGKRDIFDIILHDRRVSHPADEIFSGRKWDVELLGQLDMQPNFWNEKIVNLDVDKILYYIGLGVTLQQDVAELLGTLGVLPVHPAARIRLSKLHETRKNMAEDSGAVGNYGGYLKYCEAENRAAREHLTLEEYEEKVIEERKEMVARRILMREKGVESSSQAHSSGEPDYDDDDEDVF